MKAILQLQKSGEINWFYFQFHDKPDDPENMYFDVVFTTEKKDPTEFLPKYCVSTDKISPITSISGISEKILEDGDIRKAWKLVGDLSEFAVNFVCAHDETQEIPSGEVIQCVHFFLNKLFLGGKSLCFPWGDHKEVSRLLDQLLRERNVPGGFVMQF